MSWILVSKSCTSGTEITYLSQNPVERQQYQQTHLQYKNKLLCIQSGKSSCTNASLKIGLISILSSSIQSNVIWWWGNPVPVFWWSWWGWTQDYAESLQLLSPKMNSPHTLVQVGSKLVLTPFPWTLGKFVTEHQNSLPTRYELIHQPHTPITRFNAHHRFRVYVIGWKQTWKRRSLLTM